MGQKYKPLPIGVDDFEKIIMNDYFYVDKTLFVKELLDKKGDVNLFMRPRRFGKTLSLSMLRYFFEKERGQDGSAVDHSVLFQGLNIMKADEKYLKEMGQYPVIFLTLKSAKQPDFPMAYAALKEAVAYEYRRHGWVLQMLENEGEKKKFDDIANLKAGREDYNNSLQFLSQCLEKAYGRKTIILIDEYDVPLENAYFSGFYDEMTGFMRSLFESALKTNLSLEFSVLYRILEKDGRVYQGKNRKVKISYSQ